MSRAAFRRAARLKPWENAGAGPFIPVLCSGVEARTRARRGRRDAKRERSGSGRNLPDPGRDRGAARRVDLRDPPPDPAPVARSRVRLRHPDPSRQRRAHPRPTRPRGARPAALGRRQRHRHLRQRGEDHGPPRAERRRPDLPRTARVEEQREASRAHSAVLGRARRRGRGRRGRGGRRRGPARPGQARGAVGGSRSCPKPRPRRPARASSTTRRRRPR